MKERTAGRARAGGRFMLKGLKGSARPRSHLISVRGSCVARVIIIIISIITTIQLSDKPKTIRAQLKYCHFI